MLLYGCIGFKWASLVCHRNVYVVALLWAFTFNDNDFVEVKLAHLNLLLSKIIIMHFLQISFVSKNVVIA